MQTKLLVPVLAAGLALSASVFGQNANADVGWTRSTASDSMTGANTYSPNTYRAEKSQAREQEKFQHQEQARSHVWTSSQRPVWPPAGLVQATRTAEARAAQVVGSWIGSQSATAEARVAPVVGSWVGSETSALRKSAVLGGL
jgi:hypothetical protein